MPFIEKHQPDVLCVQETKAQPEQIEIDLPGYHMYWNSADRKGYSSTGILSRTKPIRVVNGLPPEIKERFHLSDKYGDTTREGRVMMAELDNYFVVTVYTPNAKDDLSRIPMRQQWDPAFLEYCQKLEETKPVILCGDLNVAHTEDDLARPKQNEGKKGFTKEERAGLDAFIGAGFVDTFRMFTQGNGNYSWWSHWGGARERNVGWRIDYFMVSSNLKSKIESAEIHPEVLGSDHCPISIEASL